MLSVSYGKRKTKFITLLLNSMRQIAKHIEQEQEQMMVAFTNHCALLI